MIERLFYLVLGTIASPPRRDERGLSQSTENVILLVGAVTIAVIVIGLVTKYVNDHLILLGS
jgi:hypothetical protein